MADPKNEKAPSTGVLTAAGAAMGALAAHRAGKVMHKTLKTQGLGLSVGSRVRQIATGAALGGAAGLVGGAFRKESMDPIEEEEYSKYGNSLKLLAKPFAYRLGVAAHRTLRGGGKVVGAGLGAAAGAYAAHKLRKEFDTEDPKTSHGAVAGALAGGLAGSLYVKHKLKHMGEAFRLFNEAVDMAHSCECDSAECFHGEEHCPHNQEVEVPSIHGPLGMCRECAANLPEEYWQGEKGIHHVEEAETRRKDNPVIPREPTMKSSMQRSKTTVRPLESFTQRVERSLQEWGMGADPKKVAAASVRAATIRKTAQKFKALARPAMNAVKKVGEGIEEAFFPGDKVRLTGDFLHNTGQYSAPEGTKGIHTHWTVVPHENCGLCSTGRFVAVDEPSEAGQGPRHVNVANLEKKKGARESVGYAAMPVSFAARVKDRLDERAKMKLKLKKGALHKTLGVAKDKKIPASKLDAALHSKDPLTRKRANFAKNARKWHHKGRKKG